MVGTSTTKRGQNQQPEVGHGATARTYDVFRVRDAAYEPILASLKAKIIERYGTADERPSRHKQLYQEMKIGKGEWSRKLRGHTKFTFDEINFFIRHFDAPPGWPYVSWETGSANKRALETLARLASSEAPGVPVSPTPAVPSGHTDRRRRGGRK